MLDIEKIKEINQKENNPQLILLDYNELNENIDNIKKLGITGIVMFTEDVALIYFDKFPNIRLKVKNSKYYVQDDFLLLGSQFKIIGRGPDKVPNSVRMLWSDLKNNSLKIVLMIVLLLIFINPYSANIEMIRLLNEKMLDIIGIFIGMVFVFIGFFYGDKERTIDVYKKGLCHKEFSIDKYVIKLAILDMLITGVSLMASYMTINDIPTFIMEIGFIEDLLNFKSKYGVCVCLTVLSVVILVIEFDALINYYLKSMRNKYFIDAFESSINERKRK